MQLKTTIPKVRVLLWETHRLNQRDLLTRTGIVAALVALFASGVLQRNFQIGPELKVLNAAIMLIVMEMSIVTNLAWASLDSNSKNGIHKAFARPTSTLALVGVRFGYAVVTNTLLYTCAAIGLKLFLTPIFPVAGAAIVALCSAILLAALWTPATQAGRGAGAILAVILIGLVFTAVYLKQATNEPFLIAAGSREFFRFDFLLATLSTLGILVAFGITVWGVGTRRSGEMLPAERWMAGCWQWASGILNRRRLGNGAVAASKLKTATPFSSPKHAQYWCEYRIHGVPVIVFASIMSLACLVVMGSSVLLNPTTHTDIAWVFIVLLCPFAFQMISAGGASNISNQAGVVSYSPFHATRPLSNQKLVSIKLRAIALHTTIGFLIILAAAALHFTVFGWNRLAILSNVIATLSEEVPLVWWLVFAVVFLWTFTSCSAMTLNAGYLMALFPKVFWSLAGIAYLHTVALFILAAEDWPKSIWVAAYAYTAANLIVAGGVWCVWRLLAAHRTTLAAVAVASTVWLAYITSVSYVATESGATSKIPPAILATGISLLTIPLVALLYVPSALARHRHA